MSSKKYNKYCFRLEIDGIEVASFKTAGPLEGNIGVIEDKEGGDQTTKKSLGRVSFSNITLTRGVSDNDELWKWWDEAVKGKDAEKDIALVQTDRAGEELVRWNIEFAQPVRFKAAEFDADSDDNNIEEMELCHEGFTRA